MCIFDADLFLTEYILIRIRSDFDKHLDKKYCAKMFLILKKLKNDDVSTFN